jgi:hypothetical protein
MARVEAAGKPGQASYESGWAMTVDGAFIALLPVGCAGFSATRPYEAAVAPT